MPSTAGAATSAAQTTSHAGEVIERPQKGDGPAIWRLARDCGNLDLNSSYAYLLWCRDFADTSVVARAGGDVVGFVTGFRRPAAPDTLLVWQVAVDERYRGRRIASRMLDTLVDDQSEPPCYIETTVSPSNDASEALFTSFAAGRDARLERGELFAGDDFPDGHEAEVLYRIGPLAGPGDRAGTARRRPDPQPIKE
jgi:L-2,4-diaminobutyric acid acetyltransferase